VACNAKHEVSRCTTSRHLTFFYALTTVIPVPGAALFKADLVVFGLYVGVVFTFLLIFRLFRNLSYSFLHVFLTFCIYFSHPGKAGSLK
jgi:hypothetical protein